MAQQLINVGTAPNDGTGDVLRSALTKANDNFTELYGLSTGAAPDGDTIVGSDRIHGSSAGVAYDWSANQLAEFMGGQITGFAKSITIDGAGAAAERVVAINADAGYATRIQLLSGGVTRWGIARLGGGVLVVRRYDETGTPINNPISIDDATGVVTMIDGIAHNGALGFFGATPTTRPTISGSRGGNAALADLLTKLAALGLITDGTSA